MQHVERRGVHDVTIRSKQPAERNLIAIEVEHPDREAVSHHHEGAVDEQPECEAASP